jgi:hypothetical protein
VKTMGDAEVELDERLKAAMELVKSGATLYAMYRGRMVKLDALPDQTQREVMASVARGETRMLGVAA